MKLLIAIMSKGRPDTISKNTLAYVPHLGYDYKIFVEPQELAAYSQVDKNVVDIEQTDQGIGYVRNYIGRYARANDYDLVFKMDDDIKYWSTGSGKKNLDSTYQSLGAAIPASMDIFKKHTLIKGIGFNYAVFMHVDSSPLWSLNARLQGCYIVRASWYGIVKNVSTFEDFVTTFYIWSNGGYTLRCNLAGIETGAGGKIIGKNKGGEQCFDRVENSRKTQETMNRTFPGCPWKKVDRPWQWEPDAAGYRRALKMPAGEFQP